MIDKRQFCELYRIDLTTPTLTLDNGLYQLAPEGSVVPAPVVTATDILVVFNDLDYPWTHTVTETWYISVKVQ